MTDADRAIAPERLVELLGLMDLDLVERWYYGERALMYNPGSRAPYGAIFASIKDHDGPHDRRSRLSRPGVYRLAFGLPAASYADQFGLRPARPAKGQVVRIAEDPAVLNRLTPHPVYAWLGWVQILTPKRRSLDALSPLLAESLAEVRARWRRRHVA